MKVYISVDMEGISGIVSPQQTALSGRDYEKAREYMTQDVNFAIEGALEGGAEEIWIKDSHGQMDNILPHRLHEEAILVSGRGSEPLFMMQGIDESFDCVFLIGYHAMGGTPYAVHDHTDSKIVHECKVNGVKMGEIGLCAGIAGYYGVPVTLISSDRAGVEEAKNFLEPLEEVIVKEAYSRTTAHLLPLKKAHERIKESAKKAVKLKKEPFVLSSPLKLTMTFTETNMVDRVAILPKTERLDGYTVEIVAEDFIELFRYWQVFNFLGYSGKR